MVEFTNPSALMSFNNLLSTGGMGQPMSMAEAVVTQERMKDARRAEQMQALLPALLSQVDPDDVNGSLAKLVQGGVDPRNAMAVIELRLKGEQERRLRDQQTKQAEVMNQIGGLLTGAPTAPPEPAATGGGTFEVALNDVLATEGGFVANDAGKGPTNMGINSAANPDVDVKNLDREQAAKLYKERYWDVIGGDDLPPATAAVAFDTAVNMGPGTAKKLLKETDGDPAKLIARRRELYTKIAEKDPAKRQYLDGWMTRLDRLEAGIATQTARTAAADPSKLAQAGALMAASGIEGGNTLLQLANFQQGQANRAEDKASDKVNKLFDQELALSKEFKAESKDFVGKRDAFADLRTAARDNTPAGDIQLIFSLMKSFDPNSTVREGEFATAQQTAGVPGQITNWYNRALKGDRLTPEQRASFLKLGRKNYDTALKQHTKLKDQYVAKAGRYKLDPENIVFDLGLAEEPPAAPAFTIPSGSPARVISTPAERDALPSGTRYLAPDRQVRTKR